MRVLLVEDQQEIINTLKPALEEECFIVDTAEDGKKGAFMACTNDYDLVILDLNLPKQSGYVVCKAIRDDGRTVPIIMLSAISEIEKKIDLLEIGADDYITKPFSFKELLAHIKAILRRPDRLEESLLRIDNLVVDTRKYIAKRGGEKIYLTRKEFGLLKFFLENKRQILSRSEIMEHVWDIEADPFSNTIEAHVANLRKKLNKRGKKLIYSVPKRGYKIDTKE